MRNKTQLTRTQTPYTKPTPIVTIRLVARFSRVRNEEVEFLKKKNKKDEKNKRKK